MDIPLLGEAFALLTALTWAFAVVLFKFSGHTVPPLVLNLFKNSVAIVCLVATVSLAPLLGPFADNTWSAYDAFSAWDYWILIASGVLGIAVADTLFFIALNRLGVGIMSIVDCLYAPSVIFFAIALLGEELTIPVVLGTMLVLAGVFLASRHEPPPNTTRGQLIGGVIIGAIALNAMAFGITFAKPTLEAHPMLNTALIRIAAGTVALLPILFVDKLRANVAKVFTPNLTWKTAVPGAFLGSYLAYVFWVAGFKYTDASIAGILNQTSVIFTVILATVVVREKMTLRKLVAVVLAIAGALIVLIGAALHDESPAAEAQPAPVATQQATQPLTTDVHD